jgi:hypothetical protein
MTKREKLAMLVTAGWMAAACLGDRVHDESCTTDEARAYADLKAALALH